MCWFRGDLLWGPVVVVDYEDGDYPRICFDHHLGLVYGFDSLRFMGMVGGMG